MATQTLARQVIEISAAGMEKAEAVIKAGLGRVKNVASMAAEGVTKIGAAFGKLAVVGGILGGGFLATFGRQALEGTIEADRLGKSWSYLGKVIGQQLAPYVRALTDGIMRVAGAYRALSPETQALVVKIALFAAGIGSAVALLPVMVTIFGAVAAAIGALISPAGLVVVAIIGIAAAAKSLYDWFRGEAPTTSEAVDEANMSWTDKFMGYLQAVAVKGAEIFNWIMKNAAKASDWIADKLSAAGEALGVLPTGTTEELRKMDEIKAPQIDITKVKNKLETLRRMGNAVEANIKEIGANLGADGNGFGVKVAVKFEGLQGTFDRLQEAFARGDGEDLAKQQLDVQKGMRAEMVKMVQGLSLLGGVGV